MSIRQVQLVYNEEQDRLLLRFATVDQAEFRFWLTRRFVKRWWGLLTKMLAWDGMVMQQSTPLAKQAMVAFQHERHTADADFKQPLANSATSFPLGGCAAHHRQGQCDPSGKRHGQDEPLAGPRGGDRHRGGRETAASSREIAAGCGGSLGLGYPFADCAAGSGYAG